LLVAFILLAAAVLKAISLWSSVTDESGLLGSPWLQMIVIEVEAGLAVGLLCGLRPHAVRVLAMVLFSAFLGLALSKAASGARSCACFGWLEVHPWLTVGLDAGVLLLLWRWRPAEDGSRIRPRALRVIVAGSLALLAIVPVVFATSQTLLAKAPLLETESVVDLGTIRQGQRREFTLRVRNPHNHAVTISHLDASCACLNGAGLARAFSAMEETTAQLTLDLSKEPAFAGELRIRLIARTHAEEMAMDTVVRVRVSRSGR